MLPWLTTVFAQRTLNRQSGIREYAYPMNTITMMTLKPCVRLQLLLEDVVIVAFNVLARWCDRGLGFVDHLGQCRDESSCPHRPRQDLTSVSMRIQCDRHRLRLPLINNVVRACLQIMTKQTASSGDSRVRQCSPQSKALTSS